MGGLSSRVLRSTDTQSCFVRGELGSRILGFTTGLERTEDIKGVELEKSRFKEACRRIPGEKAVWDKVKNKLNRN